MLAPDISLKDLAFPWTNAKNMTVLLSGTVHLFFCTLLFGPPN